MRQQQLDCRHAVPVGTATGGPGRLEFEPLLTSWAEKSPPSGHPAIREGRSAIPRTY